MVLWPVVSGTFTPYFVQEELYFALAGLAQFSARTARHLVVEDFCGMTPKAFEP
jgi:hypothetical protein